ncbi:MAG: NAD(P)-dependent oxidoreductase, partial [Staphylococcus epidermidis]|nr:NAD(P)-dependent oxidoreductase [Staphylococcus epidermidis]
DLKVAVIGTGHIGGIVAQIFSEGYLCDVVAYDPFPSEHVKPYVTYKQSINEAIQDADIVTIHMPSTQYNNYLFNENMFQMFKKGAVFVNCARGSLVDTKALLSAIDQGQIKGAALDTYEYEVGVYTTDRSEDGLNDPLLEELITREDIIVTPHIAFYTEAAIQHLIFDALDATMEVLNTGTTQLRVN